jgi:hypothetical protein
VEPEGAHPTPQDACGNIKGHVFIFAITNKVWIYKRISDNFRASIYLPSYIKLSVGNPNNWPLVGTVDPTSDYYSDLPAMAGPSVSCPMSLPAAGPAITVLAQDSR